MNRLLSKLWFQIILILTAIAFAFAYVAYDTHKRNKALVPSEKEQAKAQAAVAAKTDNDSGALSNITRSIAEPIARFTAPAQQTTKQDKPVITEEERKQLLSEPDSLTIVNPQVIPPEPPPPVSPYYSPPFRKIPVRLVNAVDTANTDTPLIAMTTADLKQIGTDGISRVIIPAGVEIHGTASKSHIRNRITSNGTFTFVWRTRDDNNGLTLRVAGIALNRDVDPVTREPGMEDGKAGIVGELFEEIEHAQEKAAMLSFAEGVLSRGQASQTFLGLFTGTPVQVPLNTTRNAVMQGADNVVQLYLTRIKDTLSRDGYYVVINPGKEFYIYNTEVIDLRKATRAADPVVFNKPDTKNESEKPASKPEPSP